MNYDHKTVIVTGAGRGIGGAIAIAYAHEGANVVIAEVDEEQGQQTATSIGGKAIFVACDVSGEEDILTHQHCTSCLLTSGTRF